MQRARITIIATLITVDVNVTEARYPQRIFTSNYSKSDKEQYIVAEYSTQHLHTAFATANTHAQFLLIRKPSHSIF